MCADPAHINNNKNTTKQIYFKNYHYLCTNQ